MNGVDPLGKPVAQERLEFKQRARRPARLGRTRQIRGPHHHRTLLGPRPRHITGIMKMPAVVLAQLLQLADKRVGRHGDDRAVRIHLADRFQAAPDRFLARPCLPAREVSPLGVERFTEERILGGRFAGQINAVAEEILRQPQRQHVLTGLQGAGHFRDRPVANPAHDRLAHLLAVQVHRGALVLAAIERKHIQPHPLLRLVAESIQQPNAIVRELSVDDDGQIPPARGARGPVPERLPGSGPRLSDWPEWSRPSRCGRRRSRPVGPPRTPAPSRRRRPGCRPRFRTEDASR